MMTAMLTSSRLTSEIVTDAVNGNYSATYTYDAELDNYYLRARYYNQNVGRFTQQDTWFGRSDDPITLNKYLYGNSQPITNIDPSGHMSLVWVMINITSKLNTVRKTASRLCRICAQLTKRANDAGKLLEKFSYKQVKKATAGSKYHAHHVFQDAAMRAIYQTTYRKALGLAIPLFGNNLKGGARKGSLHHAANLEQKGDFKRNPSHVAYKALNAAGCKKSDAAEIVLMF